MLLLLSQIFATINIIFVMLSSSLLFSCFLLVGFVLDVLNCIILKDISFKISRYIAEELLSFWSNGIKDIKEMFSKNED